MKSSFDANVSRVKPRQRLTALAIREEMAESISEDLAQALLRPRLHGRADFPEETGAAEEARRAEEARQAEEARKAE
ncbi:MAG: hypothetical protein DIU72_002835, partial [Pseudomonadota bacterium]